MADLTYERVLELFAESDRRFEQRMEKLAESRSESDKRIEKINSELTKKIGELGDTLGRFAEEQVRADIINKFGQWGIPVHAITNHYSQKDDNNDTIYEVDILIYNSQYAIAIEVKNTLRPEHVDGHIQRMAKIQQHPMVGLQGKTLLAGVAGMIIANGADKYAENKGIFVLKPSGDTIQIANNKNSFKPKEWEVK